MAKTELPGIVIMLLMSVVKRLVQRITGLMTVPPAKFSNRSTMELKFYDLSRKKTLSTVSAISRN